MKAALEKVVEKIGEMSRFQELRRQCQDFATALLDHTRSSYELEVLLNHDPTGPAFEHGERMHLNRLKLAIKLRQKKVNLKRKETFYPSERRRPRSKRRIRNFASEMGSPCTSFPFERGRSIDGPRYRCNLV